MGFSVSGSFAILVLASFIAFGMLYPASANGFELMSEASKSVHETNLDRRNTAINISEATYQGSHLDVNVTNTGTTALSLNATDVMVDGVYYTREETQQFRVRGETKSEILLPGETLWVRIQIPGGDPGRVKVVTEYGVADAEVVS